jgi:3-dehydroquinate dehydratase II
MKRILIMHGPNLDQLGTREPEVYGTETLSELNEALRTAGLTWNLETEFFQSNHEGELIDRLHGAKQAGVDGVLLNPGGLAHTSVVLRDAIASAPLPVVEVHLSNTHARESFRRIHLTASACQGMIAGLGRVSYLAGLYALGELLAPSAR